jgi:hypothetical protein
MPQLPARFKTSNVNKLRDAAQNEAATASRLRRELSATKAELQTVDWWGEGMAAVSNVTGTGVAAALRGAGVTSGREHLEPVAAAVLGLVAYRSESPILLHFATGLASRHIGELVEKRVSELRAAMPAKSTQSAADPVAEPATAGARVRAA